MAVERRKITNGYGQGHITFPRSKIGQEVILIYDDDLVNFRVMITNGALLEEANRQRLFDMEQSIKDFSARLAFVERFLTSMQGSSGSQSKSIQREPESFGVSGRIGVSGSEGSSGQVSQ